MSRPFAAVHLTSSSRPADYRSISATFTGWENWRADKSALPAAAIGKKLDGWPDEKWLDTRSPGVRAVMKARILLAASKGCDGVDPDNIDGYDNDTGFPLTEADGVDYVRFLAQTAHDAGLAYGLKNGGAIVDRVVDVAEWEINEQCVQYSECADLQPFIRQGKPVFHIEYTGKDPAPRKFVDKVCGAKGTSGFSTVIKHMNLNQWTETCHERQVNAARRRV